MESIEQIFQTISDYQKLEFSHCIKVILNAKNITVRDLYEKLIDDNYYITIGTVYRYFNSSSKSNRFPPQEFMEQFVRITNLNHQQAEILFQYYFDCKLLKKYSFPHS